jgi:hypothetical protein
MFKFILGLSVIFMGLSSQAMPWNETNINSLFATICNLNTNYTNTGVVDSDIYLHKINTQMNYSQAMISGTCSQKIDQNNKGFGGYHFEVMISTSDFDPRNSGGEKKLSGYLYSENNVRSFEILLIKKFSKIVNSRLKTGSNMAVKQVIVYPYQIPLEETDGIVNINSETVNDITERNLLGKAWDFIYDNLNAANILRVAFETTRWDQGEQAFNLYVPASRMLRGFYYRVPIINGQKQNYLLLDDRNLLDHVRMGSRGGADFATDVFLNIDSSRVLGCSYANNDDGSKNSQRIVISTSDCLNLHRSVR